MDSLNYEQLLNVQGAKWIQEDFDDNNNGFFFIQTHVSQIHVLLSVILDSITCTCCWRRDYQFYHFSQSSGSTVSVVSVAGPSSPAALL